jgi:hypothetical protein
MSKLAHFRDQLAATNNPDPVLYWIEQTDDGFLEFARTKQSELVNDLVGMRFLRMDTIWADGQRTGTYPVFISELVDV